MKKKLFDQFIFFGTSVCSRRVKEKAEMFRQADKFLQQIRVGTDVNYVSIRR